MKEAVAIAKGERQPSRVFTVDYPEVKAVREKTGLSQAMFAAMIGAKVKTCRTGSSTAVIPQTQRRPC